MKTTTPRAGWARRYQTALRRHLERGAGPSLRLVQSLGREAVSLGLETLDLAKTHEEALRTVMSPHDSPRMRDRAIQRARTFFAEAAVRIEKTHCAARKADALVEQLNRALRQRTRESCASTRRLKQISLERRRAEASLKASGKRHARLLSESRSLLEHLRNLTHACMSAQEDDRTRVSREFRDEIAQGLLGIHVRLLTLKKAAKACTANMKEEIADTQQHMVSLTRKVDQFVHERGTHHDT